MSFKPKTCQRYNVPWHAHALTFSCCKKTPLLDDHRVCAMFVKALDAARQRHECDIWAYVVMPDHVHLVIWPRRESYSVSAILAGVKRPVSYWTGKAGLRIGKHFWEPGGEFDRNLWRTDTIHREIDYIHANPVRRGLWEAPDQWKFSSAAYWSGCRDVPLAMDHSLPPRTK